jgi:hypothetical protein
MRSIPFGWIFQSSPNHDSFKRQEKNCLHYKLGSLCVDCHAILIKKCSNDILMNCEYGFQDYLRVFMKLSFDDFSVFNDLKTHMDKL